MSAAALTRLGNVTPRELCTILANTRANLANEKAAQADLFAALIRRLPGVADGIHREVRLGPGDIVDIWANGVAIEVKLKGARKMDVFRQLERYAQHDVVEAIILCSNLSMGLPGEIAGKPAHFVSLGRAWL